MFVTNKNVVFLCMGWRSHGNRMEKCMLVIVGVQMVLRGIWQTEKP